MLNESVSLDKREGKTIDKLDLGVGDQMELVIDDAPTAQPSTTEGEQVRDLSHNTEVLEAREQIGENFDMKDFGEARKVASHVRLSRDLLTKSTRELDVGHTDRTRVNCLCSSILLYIPHSHILV